MTTTRSVDEQLVEKFAGELISHYTSGMVTMMVDVGHRSGLFEAAAEGPATSEELAARAGLHERYVREWLGSLVSAGIFLYSPRTGVYTLPAEHAECLTGPGAGNLATVAQINTHLGNHLHQVATAFREGGGVPYSEFRPEFTDVMDSLSRGTYDELLVDAWLPLVPGLPERLTEGIRVADVGCGTGHAVVTMAAAFPASTFVGYDIAEDALDRGRAEAAELGLTNVEFEAQDAATLAPETPFDLITTIDAIHDQVDPAGAVRSIFGALVPGGTYVMVEPAASSNLEDNLSNPFAPWIYGVSTLHCLTVSLAHGGAGLGTAWGEQRAREMLADAGFARVTAHETPGDPLDTMFVTTKPEE
ncbi:class I SAM-dependent methyltransferase [Aeromicrobium sp.]|uniref:class I SAM-dependent methyltransferase n=1 Tax=Aeromicrobium sp. TaxID=1871063 RepID=UPI002FCB60D3